ncbi:MAG: AAA family ATPase, partial [Deltaproteobacteria bacterium]|nr:AAA family ATPase [Deltaproteobacteria bacterium]
MAYMDDMRTWAQQLPYRGRWEDHEKTNWLISSPFREDRHPSFSIDLVKRTCLDRASGEKMLLSEFCQALGIEEPSRQDGKSLPSRRDDETTQAEKNRGYIQDVWNSAAPAPADFPYLQRKQVPPHSCRTCFDRNMADQVLLVPAYNASGELVGLERIPATQGQDKKHLKQKKGACHLIGTVSEGKPVYVAEGYATAASLHLITGQPVAVAFTCWNIEAVCRIFKDRHKAEPYACPDAGDAGKIAATQCRSAGFQVVELPPESRNGLDWNDVHVEQGIETARALFRDRWAVAQAESVWLSREEEKISILDLVEAPSPGSAQRPEKIWHFPRKHLNLVAADPGMGKSILMTKVASDLSIGAPVLGMIAEPVRKTLYLNGECGKDYFNWRFKASGWKYLDDNFQVVHQEVLSDKGVDLDLDTPQGRKNLENLLHSNTPDLLIIDSLPAFSDEDLNDGKAQNEICKHLKTLATKYNLAVVLITHLRKRRLQDQGTEPTLSEIQGSNAGAKLCNVALVIYE